MDKEATAGALGQFQSDFVQVWQRLPNKGFFFVLLAVWLAVFQFLGNSTFGYVHSPSLFQWMYTAYTPPGGVGATDDSVGLWVPFVVLVLFWWKRKELTEIPLRLWWPGLAVVAAGVALHVVGYLLQEPRVSIVALFVGIYGLTGLAWGPEWLRRSFFPFFLFIFCVPFSVVIEPITFRLRLLACQIVAWICHNVLAIDVIREGTILKDPGNRYQYDVAAACSGIRSLVAIGLMSTIGAFLYFRSWWRRGALILSAAPLAVAGNVLRLLSIIVTAEFAGQSWGNYVHEGGPLGIISLLPYALAFLALIGIGKYLKEPDAASPAPKPS